MILKLLVILSSLCFFCSDADVCPDQSDCPGVQTCCLMLSGQYGCCPFGNAICCKDQVHCCPEGTQCNLKSQSCDSGLLKFPFVWMLPRDSSNRNSVQPDRNVAVSNIVKLNKPDDDTNDFSPDTDNKVMTVQMLSRGRINSVYRNHEDTRNKSADSQCPDGNVCQSDSTCCIMLSGHYGCCPYFMGVCCADKIHCCPPRFECHLSDNTCILEQGDIRPMYNIETSTYEEETNIPSKSLSPPSVSFYNSVKKYYEDKLDDIVCPDGRDCAGDSSCCIMKGDRYGCCPYPSGTCCSDLLHCCPDNFRCDLDHGFCIPNGKSPAIFNVYKPSVVQVFNIYGDIAQALPSKKPLSKLRREDYEAAIPEESTAVRPKEGGMVKCPNNIDFCLGTQTCCLVSSDTYGCCSYTDGVCCGDYETCCPHGTHCTDTSCVKDLNAHSNSLASLFTLDRIPLT